MTAQAVEARMLPYGVGSYSLRWLIVVLALLAVAGVGAYAYTFQLTEGEIVTGMRDVGTAGGAPWGLYITSVVYFAGVAFAGLALAALVRLLRLEFLRPLSRTAEVLSFVGAVLATLSIIVDVGEPLDAVVNLFLYSRPMSPFFGTFTLVISGHLIASLVYLYLDARRDAFLCAVKGGGWAGFYRRLAGGYQETPEQRERHERASFWLSLGVLTLLVTEYATLAYVFGTQTGRPGWFSALQAPDFLVLAGASGVGLITILAFVLRRVLNEQEHVTLPVFIWLSNTMTLLVVVSLFFFLTQFLTMGYAGLSPEIRLIEALLQGPYSLLFWLTSGLLVLCFALGTAQALFRRYHLSLIVLCGVLVNLATMDRRYLSVVPSLTHGNLLPYPTGVYNPTWVEYTIILGLLALGTLLYVLFMKVFPIMEVPESRREG
ncbi:MAG: polysulfide reductase NrfD [Chloroflexi bacterium]|nr:polysulfide reductase NrfD [Chloroflexota bacterium]